MEFKPNEYQKKVLEKFYQRIFDQDELTEEGGNLCAQANINPDDIIIKTHDDFKNKNEDDEVTLIRF